MLIPQNHYLLNARWRLGDIAERPETTRTRIAEKSARIWSSLNGPFDIAKQNP